MESAQTPSLRRLNGRLQACEPCRLRKVACDHTQPICKRCRKRRQEQDCVYVVTNPKPSRARLQHQPTPSRTPTPRQAIPTVVAPGYFGFTSHSTVFEETRNSLSLVHGPELGPSQVVSPIEIPLTLDQPLRAKSLWVLKNLPILKDWDIPPRASTCYPDVWIYRAVVSIFQALRDSFEDYLGHGDDRLEEMVQILCENTAKPFRDESDTQSWLGQFTGSNLRWESLGLIWTFWEVGQGTLERGLVGPPRAITPNHVTVACLGYCIDLARCFSQGNDLLLWLNYRKCTMDSIVLGDASLACWSSHGATISLLTFLGRHVEPPTPYYKPTLCSENKRRMAALCFNLDKVLVAFTGRPPLLNGRYCTTPLPLDLADEDLLADEETLARAVQSLNENGWNTRGKVYRATLLRARVMCSYILDEILEYALNPRAKPSIDDLLRLKTRQLDTVATFPKSIMYDPRDIDDPDVDADIFYARLLSQLKHLQNLFFIERLMLRLGKPNEGDLLVTSFEMVSLTLIFWTHKDLFVGILRDFEWLLMAYAAPGGGILCLELLRPTFSGSHPKNPKLSRSSIVQQLSLLIGFLEWVKPSAPNGDLCQDCKAIIQKVLDHFLNTTIDGGGALETLDWNFPTQLDFNFDLLDTFDWLRAD